MLARPPSSAEQGGGVGRRESKWKIVRQRDMEREEEGVRKGR
jgi:hypothetical protein